LIGRPVSWTQAAEAFKHGFQSALGLSFQPAALTPNEKSEVERLLEERYRNPNWTERLRSNHPSELIS